ncbi:MAG: hypothetical protein IPK16_26325 [Anaerolineales bacterium]|nr:hypothetical protein [Anaerolineales bacterium]
MPKPEPAPAAAPIPLTLEEQRSALLTRLSNLEAELADVRRSLQQLDDADQGQHG